MCAIRFNFFVIRIDRISFEFKRVYKLVKGFQKSKGISISITLSGLILRRPTLSLLYFFSYISCAYPNSSWIGPIPIPPAPPAPARSVLLHSSPSPFRNPSRCPDPLPPSVRNRSRGSSPDSYSPWRPTPKSYWTQTKSVVGDRRSLESLHHTSWPNFPL
jgi:hypothetical protein